MNRVINMGVFNFHLLQLAFERTDSCMSFEALLRWLSQKRKSGLGISRRESQGHACTIQYSVILNLEQCSCVNREQS